jgi:hypothetical protein
MQVSLQHLPGVIGETRSITTGGTLEETEIFLFIKNINRNQLKG